MKQLNKKIFLLFPYFALILSFIFLFPNAGKVETGEMKMVKVFYLPFDVATYLPVTPVNIEKEAQCVFRFPFQGDDIKKLKDILNTEKRGNFIDKLVRLKIVGLYSEDVYVDIKGGLRKGNNESKLINRAFSDLKVLSKEWEKMRKKECRYAWSR